MEDPHPSFLGRRRYRSWRRCQLGVMESIRCPCSDRATTCALAARLFGAESVAATARNAYKRGEGSAEIAWGGGVVPTRISASFAAGGTPVQRYRYPQNTRIGGSVPEERASVSQRSVAFSLSPRVSPVMARVS